MAAYAEHTFKTKPNIDSARAITIMVTTTPQQNRELSLE